MVEALSVRVTSGRRGRQDHEELPHWLESTSELVGASQALLGRPRSSAAGQELVAPSVTFSSARPKWRPSAAAEVIERGRG